MTMAGAFELSHLAGARPWLWLPALLLALLVLARLARLWPSLRALLAPFAALCAAVAMLVLALQAGLRWPALALLCLLPFVVLLVRVGVLSFTALFRHGRGEAPPALLESLVAVVLYALAAVSVAHIVFGVDPTPFLATSAVVGAVIGLALQETLGSLFAGIALHTGAPFRVGDWVQLDGVDGCVEQISWRALRLRTWSNDTLTVPNNHVARQALLNYSTPRTPHSRVLHIGVSYAAPPNRVLAALGEVLEQVSGLPAQPRPILRVIGYGDFAIQYEVRYHVTDYADWRRVESEIYRLLWYQFRRAGLEIPFPIRTVQLQRTGTRGADQTEARLLRALRAIDVFRPLCEDELRLAAAAFRHVHYSRGERVLDEGDAGDSFFVIDHGEVEVSKRVGAASHNLAWLRAGQFFGEMALLTGESRTATVTAASDVDLFTIDKAGFESILVTNPAVAEDISMILAARRDALSQVADAAHPPSESALATQAAQARILAAIRNYFGL